LEDYIYDFVTRLQSISGRNDKESFIKKYKDDETIEKYLKFTLDPMKVYGLQSKKLGKFLDKPYTDNLFNDLFECFEYLIENNTGRDEDAKLVASYINSLDEKLHDFVIKSITKSIKLGANIKTINKTLGKELLTEFNVMLAHPFEKYADKIDGKTLYTTEKLDGARAIIFKWGDKIDIRTRQGHQLLGLVDIEKDVQALSDGIYDGELLIKNAEQFKDRAVLQETLKITKKDGDKTGLDFWIFDTITHEDFQAGKSKLTYSKRREILDNLSVKNLANIHVLPVLYKGKDMLEIQKILKELESKGLEGVMLNVANSFYTLNRSSGILKMKTFLEFDEEVVSIFEGEGRLKGKLGGVNVLYKGKYPLKVGSGFTDQERELYFNNPELIVGKIIAVQYFRESSNAQGGLSVSFPVFVTVTSKTEASYN